MKKRKKYIREGGICQFFDQWSDDGVHINYDRLWNAMHHPENIQTEEKRSTESYMVEKGIIKSETYIQEKKEVKPFNRIYKNYGKN